jgi:glycosyltransferase involved in cell wall biosynthesis
VISDFFMSIIATWGVDPHRTKRIYLGLPMEEESATVPSIEGKVLFSFGRFVPWKGFMLLVDLLVDLPAWTLVIAGNGPEYEAVASHAKDRGVINRVQLPGQIAREEIIGWLRRADAFVLNTSQENFSFQVLEAMREGAAIITTRVGSLPELITDGVEGVLCEPNDGKGFLTAIRSVIDEPELWKARRYAARQKALQFSIETSARETADAIRTVCRSSS